MNRKPSRPFNGIPAAILVGLCLLCAVLTGSSASAGAAAHESLYPLLGMLPDWEAGAPDGIRVEGSGLRMINAFREYTRGEQTITATIVVGNPVAAAAALSPETMEIESENVKMAVRDLKGFRVALAHDKAEQSGAVTVLLSASEQGGAAFVLSYTGLSDQEALQQAERFDWAAMLAKVKALD